MSRFLKDRIRGTQINLDHVVKAAVDPMTTRGITPTHFHTANADLGTIPEVVDLEVLTAPVIPASGAVGLAYFVYPDGTSTAVAIVGWRVGRHGAEPILLGGRPSGAEMYVAGPGGKLVGGGRVYGSLAAVLAAQTPESAPEDLPDAA